LIARDILTIMITDLFFSICSNNYLAQATVLRNSIRQFHPDIPFILFLCDQKLPSLNYLTVADEVIELEKIESSFKSLALKYNIIELNTCLKPRVFEYLFKERKIQKAAFLDPDVKLFYPLSYLFSNLDDANILLTPHILSPIPIDEKKPQEQSFLMFGIYNLGFVGVRHSDESLKFLQWWKSRTYTYGNRDTYHGNYVDQLPVNQVPLFFKSVMILKDHGLNMAPWNLHERRLSNTNGQWMVNDEEQLKFYHFSSFKAGVIELPLHYYNRFTLKDRPDLLPIYEEYNKNLVESGYDQLHHISNVYANLHQQHVKKLRRQKWIKKFLP
jgi:hypothetical protein